MGLVQRNLVGKYKNSVLGFGWNFILPILLIVIYYIVFTELRTSNLDNLWLYLATGIFPLNFMITNLNVGCSCIVGNSNIVKKMYFPRELLVLSQIISSFIILLIGVAIVILLSIPTCEINLSILMLIPALIVSFIFVAGFVFIISSLVVYVRDLQFAIGTLSIIFYFITPIYFEINQTTGVLSETILLNPFTYFIELFHQSLFYYNIPNYDCLLIASVISIVTLLIGYYTFKKLEGGFAERI